jgi:hypothetical protein
LSVAIVKTKKPKGFVENKVVAKDNYLPEKHLLDQPVRKNKQLKKGNFAL